MKFYGEPNMLVKTKKRNLFQGTVKLMPLFRFDENGMFETTDEKLINKLKLRFKYDEELSKSEKENPVVKNKTVGKTEKEEEKSILKCKKCDFATDNMGELLAHYREHKKEGE